MFSIFDIFKVGVGPSSSHTNGPMVAGYDFGQSLISIASTVTRIQADLYGSLSLTGRGHHTDKAIILGLQGNKPDTINIKSANQTYQQNLQDKKLLLLGKYPIDFEYASDMLFHIETRLRQNRN